MTDDHETGITYIPNGFTWEYLLTKINLKKFILSVPDNSYIGEELVELIDEIKEHFELLRKTGHSENEDFYYMDMSTRYLLLILQKVDLPVIYHCVDLDSNRSGTIIFNMNPQNNINKRFIKGSKGIYDTGIPFMKMMKLFFKDHDNKNGYKFLTSVELIEELKK